MFRRNIDSCGRGLTQQRLVDAGLRIRLCRDHRQPGAVQIRFPIVFGHVRLKMEFETAAVPSQSRDRSAAVKDYRSPAGLCRTRPCGHTDLVHVEVETGHAPPAP